jgi:hypothetical protein
MRTIGTALVIVLGLLLLMGELDRQQNMQETGISAQSK